MNRHAEFEDERAFARYVRDRVLQRPDWRSWRRWRIAGSACIVLESPEGVAFDGTPGGRSLASPPPDPGPDAIRLDALWCRAQPVPRGFAGEASPDCYLVVPGPSAKGIAPWLVEQAPAGLEAIRFESHEGGKAVTREAFLIRGEAGRILAHAPPHGCRGFECDRLPGGGLAALPAGWTLPPLPERLWPTGEHALIQFVENDGVFSAVEHRLVDRLPLVTILDGRTRIDRCLPDPTSGMHPAPWRVVRAPGHRSADPLDGEGRNAVRAVFRLRTFSREIESRSGGKARQVHELGQAFLAVLDECEAGILPEVRYAAVDHTSRERWHFLIVDHADERLLASWSMLERFDHLDELGTYGIHAFLSRDSRMIPPAAALVGGGSADRRIQQRIRALLGEPDPKTIVLIEDLEGPGDPLVAGTPSNPRLVHIDERTARPLSEVLETLVRDWNNSEPVVASLESLSPDGLSDVRTDIEESIRSIGADENAELGKAALAAREALASWADRSAVALTDASAPVAEATEVCHQLRETLGSAESSLDSVTARLTEYCQRLTAPRREWIRTEATRAADALSVALPIAGEAESAGSDARRIGEEVRTSQEQLQRATEALRALEPTLNALVESAAAVVSRAEQGRQQVESRAATILARIAERLAEVRNQQAIANARRDAVERERTRLDAEERSLTDYLDETDRIESSNLTRSRELTARRAKAESGRRDAEILRDVRLPEVTRQVEAEERKLRDLDPDGLRKRLATLESRLSDLAEAIRSAETDRDLFQSRDAQHQQDERELRKAQDSASSLRKKVESRSREYATLVEKGGNHAECLRKIDIARDALSRMDGKSSPITLLERIRRALSSSKP